MTIINELEEMLLPELSKVSGVPSGEPETPEILKKFLKTKQDFDAISDSTEGSEILDLFEEFHKDSFLIKRPGEKRLKKDQVVKMTMNMFTDKFKKIMAEIRQEMQIGDNMVYEDPNDDFADLKNLKTDFQPFKPMDKLPLTNVTDGKIKSLENDDFISGMWSLLEKNDEKDKKFLITPPWYDAYKQDKPHWSEKPEIPWSVVDQSRQKCEKWLKKIEEEKQKN